MRLNFGIIVFVFCLADCLCGIINGVRRSEGKHDNGKAREGSAEDGTNYGGDRSEASKDVPEKTLSMHDLNLAAESVEPSSTIKEKRCHRTEHMVRAVQNPNAGAIVGSSTPVEIERRDLQIQLNKKLCTTCMNRQQCKIHNKCDICEKWCTPGKSGTIQEPPNTIPIIRGDANPPLVGSVHKDKPTEQKVAIASRFGDVEIEDMKKIHTIATLKSGQLKEVICKLLGIPDTSDIDTLVVWATTHSNQSPNFSPHHKKQVMPHAEQLTEMLNKELSKALQMKRQQNRGDFLTDEEIMHIITYVTQHMNSEASESAKSIKAGKTSESRNSWSEEILPVYPIEPNNTDLNMPRILNPGVIEDTPSMGLVGAKQEKGATSETSFTEGKRITESTGDTKEVVGASTSTKAGTGNVGIALRGGETTEKSAEKDKSTQNENKKPLTVSPFSSESDEDGDTVATQKQVVTDSEENEEEYDEDEDNEEDDTFRTLHGKKKKKHKHGKKIHGGDDSLPIKHRANEASGESTVGAAEEGPSYQNITPNQEIQKAATLQTVQPQLAGSKTLPANRDSKLNILKPQSYDQQKVEHSSQSTRPMPVDSEGQKILMKDPPPMKIEPGPSTTAKFPTSETPSEKATAQLKAKTQEILNKIRERVGQKQDQITEEKPRVSPNTEKIQEKSADLNPAEVVGSVNTAEGKKSEPLRPTGIPDNNGQELIKSELPEPNLQSLLPTVDNFERAKAALQDVQKLVEVIQKESNVAQGKQVLGQKQQRVQTPLGNDFQAIQQTTCIPLVQSSTASGVPDAVAKVANKMKEMPQYISDKTKDTFSEIEGQQYSDIVGQPQRKVSDTNSGLVGSEPLEEIVSNGDIGKPIFGFSDLTMRRNQERMNLGSPLGTAQNDEFQQVKSTLTQLPDKTSSSQVNILRTPITDQSTSQTVPKEFPKSSVHFSYGKEVPVKESIVGATEVGSIDSKPSLLGAKPSETLLKAGSNKTGQNGIDLRNRGQFPVGFDNLEYPSWSNALGKFVPSKQDDSLVLMEPKDIYFIGNGIKLPLQMVQKQDGAVHLSVDLDKLCFCKNASCPKNHTAAIEETVGTILAKEAELKDQLTDHVVSRENREDFGDMLLGAAAPRLDRNIGGFSRDAPHRSVRGLADGTRLDNQLKYDSSKIQTRNTDGSKGSMKQSESGKSSEVDNVQEKDNKEQNQHEDGDIGGGNIRHKGTSKSSLFKTTNASRGIDQTTPDYLKQLTDKSPGGEGKLDFQQLFFPKDDLKNLFSEIEKKLFPTKAKTTPSVDKNIDLLLKPKPTDKIQVTTDGIFGKFLLSLKPTPLTSTTRNVSEKDHRGNEVYDEVTPVKSVHKFKKSDGGLESKIKYFNEYEDRTAKEDEEVIGREAMNLLKTHEDSVVREEVDIMKNFLTWLKNMATDKDRK